jgi:NifB/MoaA-like Fe-S oxidoreductase
MKIEWIDSGREPKCDPDPNYPNGIDVNGTLPGERSCKVDLPYPAKRCGLYVVTCSKCGIRVATTTAGRPDDPRSITIPCKETIQ